MLYKLMSSWFIEVLVVLFCIGGIEALLPLNQYKILYFCIWLANLLGCPFVQPWDFVLFFDIAKILLPCKTKDDEYILEKPVTQSFYSPKDIMWFKHAGESYSKVPFLGAISYLTLAVSLFCITFVVLWAIYRDESFAWIGQDILVGINFSSIKCFSSPL
ncbi:hypothetical protein VNO78_07749 [Psophocarpus tetragonolobus]|uniref:Uncharacterized protein n=1 Tax=Psophocarpus tetragonolobus TaxID=3891 RepID=A0AAN9SWP1_PSOTE